MVTQDANAERRTPLTRDRVLEVGRGPRRPERHRRPEHAQARPGARRRRDGALPPRPRQGRPARRHRRGRSSARSSEPQPGGDWKAALREQVMAARRVMLRHPWARRVLEERGTAGPRSSATSSRPGDPPRRRLLDRPRPPRAARPGQPDLRVQPGPVRRLGPGDPPPNAGDVRALAGRSYPRSPSSRCRSATRASSGACDDDVEFAFGLDLILDGLERVRAAS